MALIVFIIPQECFSLLLCHIIYNPKHPKPYHAPTTQPQKKERQSFMKSMWDKTCAIFVNPKRPNQNKQLAKIFPDQTTSFFHVFDQLLWELELNQCDVRSTRDRLSAGSTI